MTVGQEAGQGQANLRILAQHHLVDGLQAGFQFTAHRQTSELGRSRRYYRVSIAMQVCETTLFSTTPPNLLSATTPNLQEHGLPAKLLAASRASSRASPAPTGTVFGRKARSCSGAQAQRPARDSRM